MSVAASASKHHHYPVHMKWTGNTGTGTNQYRGYERARHSSRQKERNQCTAHAAIV